MEGGALGELFRGDLEANVVEWMGSYFPRANFLGNEDKFLMKKKAEWDLNDTVCKNALLAFKAGKNGGEVVRERQTEMRNQPKESFVSRPMCKLPDDCSYACYKFPGHSGCFFLVIDPRHLFSNSGYIFLIYGLRCDTLSVVSDVPTMLFGSRESITVYGSTNEIANRHVRDDIFKQLSGSYPPEFGEVVYRFVRQRSFANEKSLDDYDAVMCDTYFEVEGGRITKAWRWGERLNIDFGGCYFETLAQWVSFVFHEDDLERVGRFTYLVGKKRKEEQAKKLQNEIKIEEEGKKKNEKDPFGEK